MWRALVVLVSACALPHDGADHGMAAGIIDQIISAGYPAELHHVTTEDGYILGVHRIPYGRDGPSEGRRPVVFVMHGLMGSSGNFAFMDPENGLAYNLADAGYDVWLGNARGNPNSRAHEYLNPDDSQQKHEFFDHSWEETGLIDIPAMVDHALAQTGASKLHYIGHSMGGTFFLVMNSMRPEYNEKFLTAHLLAGVGYMAYFPSTSLWSLSLMTDSLYALAKSMDMVEVASLDEFFNSLSLQGFKFDFNCSAYTKHKEFCEMISHNVGNSRTKDQGFSGGAIKTYAHYGQNLRDRAFRRWNYGGIRNLKAYGSLVPPSYDLKLITVNVTMHYSVSDIVLDERDVLAMATDMPNTVARRIERENFSHFDFITAIDAKELVTNYIIAHIQMAELT